MVGDTGFEPVTSTVCEKHKKKGKRRKLRQPLVGEVEVPFFLEKKGAFYAGEREVISLARGETR